MGLPEALRAKAMQLFAEYLDQLPEEAVHELVSGDQALASLRVDRRLRQARAKGIEETYAFLNGLKGQPDVKNLLTLTAPVSRAKSVWIDYTLETLFGHTYTPPPPPPKASGKGTSKTKKIPWDPFEAEKLLASSTSVGEGEEYLTATNATIKQLMEFALSLRLPVKRGNRPEVIKSIVQGTIQARGSFQRALNS